MENLPELLSAAGQIVGGASVIAAVVRPGWKGLPILGHIIKLINLVAFNFGSAKNAK